ncbi:MAG: carbohydrate ABC transporter substrate-binding protein [Campylobacteraceae bacterium]|nr:carbohydrate ABC transporter substrate-binding protein [Campylobacteraceae bacterium]
MKTLKKMTVALSLLGSLSLYSAEVEVLHWWSSGSEAESIGKLKGLLEESGHTWKDFSVAGGNGVNAMTVLKSRVIAGNPPSAAQIKGPSIQEWSEIGSTLNLNDVAKANNWDKIIPARFAEHMKYKGNYVAVPVNVHKINWMWVNPAIFKKAGASIPTTWEQFEVAAKKIKAAGFIPVAAGGQAWQETTMFETIVLGVGGADFYTKALVDLDEKALASDTIKKSFDILRMVKSFTDKNAPGRDWNLATSMVYKGEAAMLFMGDWAKGEFKVAGKKVGIDYVALDTPQTSGSYIYNIDSFVMFDQKDAKKAVAQKKLAQLILDKSFQVTFNTKKGSIPISLEAPRTQFDDIALRSMDQLNAASYSKTLVPSMAHQMAITDNLKGVFFDVVTNFYNSKMSSAEATKILASTIKSEKE